MRKMIPLAALLGCAAILLCGCSAAGNPLVKAEATPVPGLSMALHAAAASGSNADELCATLYFRYMDQPMLAGESRALTVPRDESAELALINALLEGPSAGHLELTRLFPETVRVESVAARDGLLFVTFNQALLTDDGVPANWRQDAAWAAEAPRLRLLTIQSLVASITESFPYTGVQIMISGQEDGQAGQRLDNSYFLSGQGGLSDPQLRNEALLLTPQNTVQCLLRAWQQRDYDTLYAYTAASGANGEPRPLYEGFALALDACPTLTAYSVSAGSVSHDGASAVLTVSLSLSKEGAPVEIPAYPLRLDRENGVWKIGYDTLSSLMAG